MILFKLNPPLVDTKSIMEFKITDLSNSDEHLINIKIHIISLIFYILEIHCISIEKYGGLE